MIADNRCVLDAVEREKDQIARVAETFAEAVRNGGRLIFVGAGTSGRLGRAGGRGDAAHLRPLESRWSTPSWPEE